MIHDPLHVGVVDRHLHLDIAEFVRVAHREVDHPLERRLLFQREREPLVVGPGEELLARGVENLLFVESFGERVHRVGLGDEASRLLAKLRVREQVPHRVGDAVGDLRVADGRDHPHVDPVDHSSASSRSRIRAR